MVQKQRPKKRYTTPSECPLCKEGVDPSYKNYGKLREMLTARVAIVPKKYSGMCSRHQRMLSKEIKRARGLGLLPFIPEE